MIKYNVELKGNLVNMCWNSDDNRCGSVYGEYEYVKLNFIDRLFGVTLKDKVLRIYEKISRKADKRNKENEEIKKAEEAVKKILSCREE